MTSHATPHSLVPHTANDRLGSVAHVLAAAAAAEPGHPDLVGLVDLRSIGVEPAAGEPPDQIVLAALSDPDPVNELLGLTAPSEFWAVGLVTGARVRALDGSTGSHGADRGGDADGGTTFVHLVDRQGTSVSILADGERPPMVSGPGPAVVEGRVADACRRMLGLPTGAAPGDMTAHVVDLWLARVTRAALEEPGMGWAEVVARNPATELASPCSTSPTPAAMARRTIELGEQLDWDRYRLRCVDAGGTPFGELDGEVAAWMDAGMFARWMLGESLPWPAHADLLEGLLSPPASERLRLTLDRLAPAQWPPR